MRQFIENKIGKNSCKYFWHQDYLSTYLIGDVINDKL